MGMRHWTTVAIREEYVEDMKAILHHTGEGKDKPTRVIEALVVAHLKKMAKKYDMEEVELAFKHRLTVV